MLRRKAGHRDMADVNIYTAKRLNDMALSLGELAKSCEEENGKERMLTKEDGLTAVNTAAVMVCGDCQKCGVYADSIQKDSYFLYYLLRSFEQKKRVDEEDMPQAFQDMCRIKGEYLKELNKSLGRSTMNLAWKNRFLESRDALIMQFRELAVILEEFSHQMEEAQDVTSEYDSGLKRAFKAQHMVISGMLVLAYENGQRELFVTIKSGNGKCMTVRDAADLVGSVLGGGCWTAAKDSKSIITRQFFTFHFLEEGSYRMAYGAATAARAGEIVSGDSYSFTGNVPGQVIISLSDGMGSGQTASEESERVVDLVSQLMETGFSARAALKMVNTVLLLSGAEQHPATIDLACIDLHTGVLEMMKLGAAATLVIGEDGVELLETGEVPMGILNDVEPILISRKLWEENWVIMVSDGVLDILPGDDKEEVMRDYLAGQGDMQPQEMAEDILRFACSFSEFPRDDMTVLAARIWKRK
ncbi:SpoIIE family protein phosphatase [Clostridium sp. AM58-1XD]|uniref:SpoIIE family protein phosphatase n=1 Tax=Clostridium sp. AM58-1XD TaxID=2292307 RepID=UPI0026C65D6E